MDNSIRIRIKFSVKVRVMQVYGEAESNVFTIRFHIRNIGSSRCILYMILGWVRFSGSVKDRDVTERFDFGECEVKVRIRF